jgi:hypothetical protein
MRAALAFLLLIVFYHILSYFIILQFYILVRNIGLYLKGIIQFYSFCEPTPNLSMTDVDSRNM